ncbi:MAG: nucleotide triphosphate diphosphatase NUDT15 [Candidatus Asgardarchaeia archaeon]
MEQTKDQGVKVGLTAMIVRDGKVLLGERNNTETAKGLWAFPGGRMDYGETPKSGLAREVFEETGLVVDFSRLKFLRYANEPFIEEKKHYVSLVFLVWGLHGEPEIKEPDKCKEWKWFFLDELPSNIFIPCLNSINIYKDEVELLQK